MSSQSDAHNACLIDQADLRAYYGHGECVGPSYTAAGIGYYSVYDDLPVSSIKAQYYFPPAGFTCPSGQHFDAPGQCVADVVRDSLGCQCSVAFARRPVRALVDTGDRGNPASASTGNKYTGEIDFSAGDAILPVGRFYNSQFNQDLGFGFGWISRFINHVVVSGTTFVIRDNSGREELFTCITSGTCTGSADSQLTVIKDWTGYSVVYRDRMVEKYNSLATIERQIDSNGRTTTYNYDHGTGVLNNVTGPFGHQTPITFSGNHIATIKDPTGNTYTYSYDGNNNLTQVTYPDGAAKLYHYENTDFPHALTGISYKEPGGNPVRYATYSYDANGKAIVTEHAGGVQHFGFSYDSDTQTTVSDAINTQEVMTFSSNLGIKNLVSNVNSSDGKALIQTFDASNNLSCRHDEEGRVTTYLYNSTNQLTSKTEGLTGSCASPVATTATRTMTYQYLPTIADLPTVITYPSVFPGQSKRVTLAYDDTGHPFLPTAITLSGYTPSGAPVSRAVALTYTSAGQVATINGARTDVSDLTTFTYNNCTSGGSCGRPTSVKDALNHITNFNTYDAAGRLTQMTDPNALKTNYTYDTRGRVKTITQTPSGGTARTTTYIYNAANNVTSVTFPDGIVLTYTYDAAQLLRQVTDNLGNKVVYDYDLKGNRTQAYTYDPTNTLVRAIDLAYDARNHVNQINHSGSITQQIADAIGNLTSVTDPNANPPTQNGFDALNRLVQTLNSAGGTTTYGYDIADRLTQVTAPNNATTQYVYDDLGNLLQEISPDRGTTSYTYDSAGNVLSKTDARGIVVNYTYDALNRVTRVTYPASSSENIAYTYDSGTNCTAGIGRLCQVVDASGTTQYGYDAYGNVTREQKTELGI
ncbi:MAG: DUF6531 domain-containing protein, partial [Sulfurifustis sp.]